MAEPEIELFQAVGRDMYLTGLVSSHTGTMSVREADQGIRVTRRDAMLGRLSPGDLIELPLTGEGTEQAPLDAVIHQAIYDSTDASAVIYARPPATMALALIEDRLGPANGEGADVFGMVAVAISQRPMGSPELGDLIGHMLKDSRVIALRGHGVFAWGGDLDDALHMVSLLEEMCRVAHIFKSLSHEEEQPEFPERGQRRLLEGVHRPQTDGFNPGNGPRPAHQQRRPNVPRRSADGSRRRPADGRGNGPGRFPRP